MATQYTNKDTIYSHHHDEIDAFSFNKKVVDVFPDMISRSVPGYHAIITGIAKLSAFFVKDKTNIYDLGCSLGAVSLAVAKSTQHTNCGIIGIDNSPDMIDSCQRKLASFSYSDSIEIIEGDINQAEFVNASVIIMNFTLQFIPRSQRDALLGRIHQALHPGGVLIISEKIRHENTQINDALVELHHDFKRENGYSELEIAQKRSALENVMVLDTQTSHLQRFSRAGFASSSLWYQNLNFASFIAVKKS